MLSPKSTLNKYQSARSAHFKDPLTAQVGYNYGDNRGCSICQFKWFDSVPEMLAHFANVELYPWLCSSADRSAARREVEQLVSCVLTKGLTEEARESFNQNGGGNLMLWWGSLADLMSGETAFSRELLNQFAQSHKIGNHVSDTDMPAFLKFLRCGGVYFQSSNSGPFKDDS